MAFAQLIAMANYNMMHYVMIPLVWISYNQILNLRCLSMYTYNCTCTYRFTLYVHLLSLYIIIITANMANINALL